MVARRVSACLILAWVVASAAVFGEEAVPMRLATGVFETPEFRTAESFEEEGLSAVFFRGRPWKGKTTEVFAWIGTPQLAPGERAPGIVLVHGGGGTAFASWVKLWTSRGYVAIAMDTCGTVPRGKYGDWERHESGGPPGNDFTAADSPSEDQWPYHAVSDVVIAHSLLRSLPEVDPERVGLTGISWGGYLTCIVSGLDHRFQFAAPVYGCGFLGEDSAWKSEIADLGPTGERWLQLWDPSHYLPLSSTPKLWVTGTNDFAYPLNSLQKSYRVAGGASTLAIRLRMPHGHGAAGEGPEEIQVFADSILQGKPPLTKLSTATRIEGRLEATYEAAIEPVRAELLFTKDEGPWNDRLWDVAEGHLSPDDHRVFAELPDGARVAFLNVYDEQGRVVSTEHMELD